MSCITVDPIADPSKGYIEPDVYTIVEERTGAGPDCGANWKARLGG